MEKNKMNYLCIILACCVILTGIGGFYLGMNFGEKKVASNDSKVEENKPKEEKEKNDDELDKKEISLLNDRVNLLSQFANAEFPMYEDADVSQEHKNYVVLSTLEDEFVEISNEEKIQAEKCADGEGDCLGNNPCADSTKISAKIFEENYNKYFDGKISSYKTQIPYNYDENGFYYIGYCGGFYAEGEKITYNYKHTKEGEYYYVYQSVGYDEMGKIFSDVNKTKLITTINNGDEYTINDKNYNDFSKYRFKYKKVNNDFVFIDIEKL